MSFLICGGITRFRLMPKGPNTGVKHQHAKLSKSWLRGKSIKYRLRALRPFMSVDGELAKANEKQQVA